MSGFRPDGTVRIVFRYIKSCEPEFGELVLDRKPLLQLAQAKSGGVADWRLDRIRQDLDGGGDAQLG